MNCEIITIGDELLSGHTKDVNTPFLARELSLMGVGVTFFATVGDDLNRIKDVLSLAIKRSDLIIVAGGLGPTEDDLTREAIAEATGSPLFLNDNLLAQIEKFFRTLGYKMSENNKRQALLPRGSVPVPNEIGTAPGFMMDTGKFLLIAIPGVPEEVKYLWKKHLFLYLKNRFHLSKDSTAFRILKIAGMGESEVAEKIEGLLNARQDPSVSITASPGDISIKITAHGDEKRSPWELIAPLERKIGNRLGINIYGKDEETLEGVVNKLLIQGQETLSIIETFSGGELTSRLKKSPGCPLKASIVAGQMEQVFCFIDKNGSVLGMQTNPAIPLAKVIQSKGESSIGLALIGDIHRTRKGYEVQAHLGISGRGLDLEFNLKSFGSDIPVLQQRAACITLNTLRKSLIKKGNQQN